MLTPPLAAQIVTSNPIDNKPGGGPSSTRRMFSHNVHALLAGSHSYRETWIRVYASLMTFCGSSGTRVSRKIRKGKTANSQEYASAAF